MKLFNSFQAVSFFAAAPFGLSWLQTQQFAGSTIGFWVGCVIYFVSFIAMIASVRAGIDKLDF
jgi:hypothetical protein